MLWEVGWGRDQGAGVLEKRGEMKMSDKGLMLCAARPSGLLWGGAVAAETRLRGMELSGE